MEQPKVNDNLVVNISKPIKSVIPEFGNQLATMLARVLDELEKSNQEAIGPIVSILEPYIRSQSQPQGKYSPKIF